MAAVERSFPAHLIADSLEVDIVLYYIILLRRLALRDPPAVGLALEFSRLAGCKISLG